MPVGHHAADNETTMHASETSTVREAATGG